MNFFVVFLCCWLSLSCRCLFVLALGNNYIQGDFHFVCREASSFVASRLGLGGLLVGVLALVVGVKY
jgi:hypothetical protein